MMREFQIRAAILVSVFVCVPVLRGQDPPKTDPQVPLPPIGADDGSSRTGAGAEVPYSVPEPDVQPDPRPITGFQSLSLGMKPANRNILLPSFTVATSIGSSPYQNGQSNNSQILSTTTVAGRVGMNRTGKFAALTLDYTVGGTFPSDPRQGISGVQSLSISDSIQHGRWSLMAGDALSYSANSPFGFGGLGGINNLGVGVNGNGPSFEPGVVPDQSIVLSGAGQFSNSVMLQMGYALSHRSTYTAGLTYGVGKILGGKLPGSTNISLQNGYSYMASRSDSIGVSYGYSRFMYSTSVPASQGHVVQFTYARQVTGRLSLRVGGGPSFQAFTKPLAGPSTTMSWALSTSLNYALGYLSTGLSYSHGQSGGSGIFPGAETDSLTANAGRGINRDWSTSFSGGYSQSKAFQQTSTAANLSPPKAYFVGVSASRKFFQRGSLFLSYQVSKQLNLGAVCPLAVCQVGALTQTGSVGYTWSLRPIIFE